MKSTEKKTSFMLEKKEEAENDKALLLSRDFSVSILFELWLAHQTGSK